MTSNNDSRNLCRSELLKVIHSTDANKSVLIDEAFFGTLLHNFDTYLALNQHYFGTTFTLLCLPVYVTLAQNRQYFGTNFVSLIILLLSLKFFVNQDNPLTKVFFLNCWTQYCFY